MTKQPETLAEDLKVLAESHKALAAAGEELARFGQWRSVPGMPALEIRGDGRAARLTYPVLPQLDGYVVAQNAGLRVRARMADLHRAAWPELWPGVAPVRPVEVHGSEPEPDDRPKGRPFAGVEAVKARRTPSEPPLKVLQTWAGSDALDRRDAAENLAHPG